MLRQPERGCPSPVYCCYPCPVFAWAPQLPLFTDAARRHFHRIAVLGYDRRAPVNLPRFAIFFVVVFIAAVNVSRVMIRVRAIVLARVPTVPAIPPAILAIVIT